MNFKIVGTGMYVPENIVTNDDLAKIVDTSDEWITQRVGVRQRHICVNETAEDLAFHAAENALENSGIKAGELDLILVATVSGETVSPSIACMVQKRLGASCLAFDINAACSAFIFLLETAAGFFSRGTVKKALLIGTERMSRIIDWTDRSTCVIMGDGAGAVVIQEGGGYLSSTFTVKGDDSIMKIPQFIGNSPFFKLKQEKPYFIMNGQETFKFAVNAICSDIEKLLELNKLTFTDIKYIIPHQANKRIIDFASKRLSVEENKFFVNIDRYGNTSSASIPIALDEMNREGLINSGDLLLLTAFGGGLSNASCIIKW
jgi:3-oxoacyl-[acyl-carrier-protein] synthase-3